MSQPRPITAIMGAGGAIGGAIATRLAADHRLAVLGRDADRLAEVAAPFPAETLALAVDATSAAAVDEAFARIDEAGGLTALVIAVGTTSGASLHEIDDAGWTEVIASNLTTVFQTMRAGISSMLPRGGGDICVIGSVHAADPQPGFPAYAAAKAGVAALAKQAAAEYGHHGIRVNVVTPGWTRAPHTTGRLDPSDEALLLDSTPLRELVEPTDIADAVAWFLSDQARRITGADLVVDGGARLLGGAATLRSGYRGRLGLPADATL